MNRYRARIKQKQQDEIIKRSKNDTYSDVKKRMRNRVISSESKQDLDSKKNRLYEERIKSNIFGASQKKEKRKEEIIYNKRNHMYIYNRIDFDNKKRRDLMHDDGRAYKIEWQREAHKLRIFGWLLGFYGISTFVDYLMPNPF